MAQDHKHTNYLAIFGVLIVLTVLEIVVAKLPHWSPATANIHAITIILLVGMALVKALLVALYFMHLKLERATFIWIVSSPLLLAVILVVALLPDVSFGK